MNCFLLKIIASLMLLSLTCLANSNGNVSSPAPSPLAKKLGLQHGDLIFIKTSGSAFDKAISQATQKDEVSYTHIGIFDLHLDSVLEAEPKQGVVRKKLEIFLKENPLFDIMRLTPKVAKNVDIQASIKRAEKHLGEPYDFTSMRVPSPKVRFFPVFCTSPFEPIVLPSSFKAWNLSSFVPACAWSFSGSDCECV